MDALIIFLLCALPYSIHGIPFTDVTYKELEELDATCNNLDSCKLQRLSDTLWKYTCNCDSFCSNIETCCIDSPYRGGPVREHKPSCKALYGEHKSSYYMVDRCPPHGHVDNQWENLCSGQWDDESLMSLVPVTSLSTEVTYKNYFCFRCHESGDRYIYWNVHLSADEQSDAQKGLKNVTVRYEKLTNTWMASIGKESTSVPVTLSITIPDDISMLPKLCVLDVISTCSDNWHDDAMRLKCNAYTSFVSFRKNGTVFKYKNPHCALCNSENLEKMQCSMLTDVRTTAKKPFSLTYLLDVNRADGNKVGKVQQCGNNAVWDPYFEKCKAYKCAFPGYVVKDGKCTPL